MCKSRPKHGQVSHHSRLQIRAGKYPKLMTACGIKRRETPACTTAASLLACCLPSVDLVESRGDSEQETSCAVVGTDAAWGEKGASPEGRSLPHVGGGEQVQEASATMQGRWKGLALAYSHVTPAWPRSPCCSPNGKADFSSSGHSKGHRWWLSPSQCGGDTAQAEGTDWVVGKGAGLWASTCLGAKPQFRHVKHVQTCSLLASAFLT